MNTYTGNGGWLTHTTGVDISQWQGSGTASEITGYSCHPYTIEFQDSDSRITRAVIESINESMEKIIYYENKLKKGLNPFDDDELNALLFEEES